MYISSECLGDLRLVKISLYRQAMQYSYWQEEHGLLFTHSKLHLPQRYEELTHHAWIQFLAAMFSQSLCATVIGVCKMHRVFMYRVHNPVPVFIYSNLCSPFISGIQLLYFLSVWKISCSSYNWWMDLHMGCRDTRLPFDVCFFISDVLAWMHNSDCQNSNYIEIGHLGQKKPQEFLHL